MTPMLSAEQRRRYGDEGVLVLPGFRDAAALAAVRARAAELVGTFEPSAQASVFDSADARRTADAWFLGSGDTVRCFLEPEALDAQGRLTVPKDRAVNKIGHALHDLDPVFERFSHGDDLAAVAAGLGLQDPQVWQSMLIFKPPAIGGEVRWHQDATYLHCTPMTVTGFWFALEDATVDNGCLWVQPGGHRGPLRERFVRAGDDSVRTEPLDDTPWPTQEDAVPVEVEAGTLVVFHGLLPHYSAPNRSPASRMAYTLHAIDGASTWGPGNWLRRRADLPVRGFAPEAR
jgi:phytanoyl-CoA hydroxylase